MTRPKYDTVTLETPAGLRGLIDDWRRGEYMEQRRLLRRYSSKELPRFLYKFRGLSAPYDVENLRAMLVHSVLRLNSPAHFNDPYELRVHIVLDSTPAQRLQRFRQMADDLGSGLTAEEKDKRVDHMMKRPDSEHVARCQESLERIRRDSGVFCFAGDPRSVLMWSHYAENHQGVCLQFERMKDFPALGHAVRVDYRDEFPTANWIVRFLDGVGRMLLAKHPAWSYEQESRITSIYNANRYLQLRPDALRSIIFGCRASVRTVEVVEGLLAERRALGAPPLSVFVATQHPTKYKLVIRRQD